MQNDRLQMPEVSVIIPMYNCEEFVPELLAMFSDQSFKDFEVICVIDGATDGTEGAVKDYCKKDNRFLCVLRENGGAGAARNMGLGIAKGKYIVFCDADDLYESDFLEKLYNIAEENKADIAVCGKNTYDYMAGGLRDGAEGFRKSILAERKVYSVNIIKDILDMINIQICNLLFRLDFIKRIDIKFSETIVGNDIFFVKAAIASAERIITIHENLMTIRRFINPQSLTSGRSKNLWVVLGEWRKLYLWLKERDLLKKCLSGFLKSLDRSVNYDIKIGVNLLYAKEMARMINCDEPFKMLNSEQIFKLFVNSFSDTGKCNIMSVPTGISIRELEKIKEYNEVKKQRNENRQRMLELVKKESLEIYGRDLDDPYSESPECSQELKKAQDRMHPAVTVVVPMYNCAEYVDGVLSMLYEQSFHDYEVICIIDGATDNTEEKVRAFCKKDSKFNYIVGENCGSGAARNTGLDMAKGEYIIFADVDNEFSPDYLRKLYEAAIRNDAHVVMCRFLEKDDLSCSENIKGFNEKSFYENIPYSHYGIDDLFVSCESCVTNKLFNTGFLKKIGLRFPENRISQDAFFSYAALSVADKILVVCDTLFSLRL